MSASDGTLALASAAEDLATYRRRREAELATHRAAVAKARSLSDEERWAPIIAGWRAEERARVADILTTRLARLNVKVWLFHPTTRKPLVKRHQLHQPSSKRQRFEMAVEKYKQSILADGVLEGAEVLVLVQDSEDAQNEKGLVEMAVVDGGTLFDAMYAAIKENPINPHCIKLLRDGVTNTLVLDHTTEDEEILFLKAVFRQQFTVPQLSSWLIPWLRGSRGASAAEQ